MSLSALLHRFCNELFFSWNTVSLLYILCKLKIARIDISHYIIHYIRWFDWILETETHSVQKECEPARSVSSLCVSKCRWQPFILTGRSLLRRCITPLTWLMFANKHAEECLRWESAKVQVTEAACSEAPESCDAFMVKHVQTYF